jgi:hypothetical protein
VFSWSGVFITLLEPIVLLSNPALRTSKVPFTGDLTLAELLVAKANGSDVTNKSPLDEASGTPYHSLPYANIGFWNVFPNSKVRPDSVVKVLLA